MRSSLIVLFFALLVFVCGRPSSEEGFLPIPGGSLLHPDCHVGMHALTTSSCPPNTPSTQTPLLINSSRMILCTLAISLIYLQCCQKEHRLLTSRPSSWLMVQCSPSHLANIPIFLQSPGISTPLSFHPSSYLLCKLISMSIQRETRGRRDECCCLLLPSRKQ